MASSAPSAVESLAAKIAFDAEVDQPRGTGGARRGVEVAFHDEVVAVEAGAFHRPAVPGQPVDGGDVPRVPVM